MSKNNAPTPLDSLPAHERAAVEDCRNTIQQYQRPAIPAAALQITVPAQPTLLIQNEERLERLQARLDTTKGNDAKNSLNAQINALKEIIEAQRAFITKLNAIENQADAGIYTQANYDAQIARAKEYTDAFVDGWQGALPLGGKPALKQQFHAIIEGTAGNETGWDYRTVMGGANRRPHTGVFQTEWAYLADARRAMASDSALKAALNRYPTDKQVLELAREYESASGLPTTSFAGQGAAFAAMAVASFKRFMDKEGSKPQNFNGAILYEEHMMGVSGARRFRQQLETSPDVKGQPGISKNVYNSNHLLTARPFAEVNDLNPDRIVYQNATARDVQQLMRDKYVHARNRMENNGASSAHILAFEQAFLPEWTGKPDLKTRDIARIRHQKETGRGFRDQAEAQINQNLASMQETADKKKIALPESDVREMQAEIACNILRPMPRPPHATERSR